MSAPRFELGYEFGEWGGPDEKLVLADVADVFCGCGTKRMTKTFDPKDFFVF